jgi:hypothetical protein
MPTKVSVITRPADRISIDSQQKMTVRYISQGASPGATRLAQLTDVDTSGKANNDVLVYDENTGKYTSKPITKVDGGSF